MDAKLLEKIGALLSGEGEKALVEMLDSSYRQYIHEYVRAYNSRNKENLDELQVFGNKLDRLVRKKVKDSPDIAIYKLGQFTGVVEVMAYAETDRRGEEDVRKKLKGLLQLKHTRDIIYYLYRNPGSRHKQIAEEIDVKPNFLSELMRKLEEAGCVVRYAEGKYSYYELSIDGRKCVKELLEMHTDCPFGKKVDLLEKSFQKSFGKKEKEENTWTGRGEIVDYILYVQGVKGQGNKYVSKVRKEM